MQKYINKKKLFGKGVCYGLLSNARLLIRELERYLRSMIYDDFTTEFITVELDDEEYLIDGICTRGTNSDPSMRHMCIKLKRPTDIGGGIIR